MFNLERVWHSEHHADPADQPEECGAEATRWAGRPGSSWARALVALKSAFTFICIVLSVEIFIYLDTPVDNVSVKILKVKYLEKL